MSTREREIHEAELALMNDLGMTQDKANACVNLLGRYGITTVTPWLGACLGRLGGRTWDARALLMAILEFTQAQNDMDYLVAMLSLTAAKGMPSPNLGDMTLNTYCKRACGLLAVMWVK